MGRVASEQPAHHQGLQNDQWGHHAPHNHVESPVLLLSWCDGCSGTGNHAWLVPRNEWGKLINQIHLIEYWKYRNKKSTSKRSKGPTTSSRRQPLRCSSTKATVRSRPTCSSRKSISWRTESISSTRESTWLARLEAMKMTRRTRLVMRLQLQAHLIFRTRDRASSPTTTLRKSQRLTQ